MAMKNIGSLCALSIEEIVVQLFDSKNWPRHLASNLSPQLSQNIKSRLGFCFRVAVSLIVVALGVSRPAESDSMLDALVIPEQPLTLDQLTALRTEVTARQEANAKAMGERADEVERRVFERALRPGSDARFDEIHRAEARRHREACAADDLVACSALGQMYDKGRGTWADEPLAFAFFLQACKVGVYKACRDFGYSSRVERGRWQGSMPHLGVLDGACDEGIAEACTQLGWTYKSGDDGL
ncbi:MAG: hypothetical protein AAF565_08310, partial [Pseudomonadota bacterium]